MTAPDRAAVVGALATMGSATALVPLYAGVPWLWPAAATVLAVVTAAAGARRARMPRSLVLLSGFAGLVLALTVGWVRAVAPLGVVPGPAAVDALLALTRAGLADAARLAAPVPPTPGLRLLAVGGIGLVALAVDTVAVTWRRPALAGLPLLALVAVPAAVLPDGLGVLPFLLGTGGYLALLRSNQRERVASWARMPGAEGADRPSGDRASGDRAGRGRTGWEQIGLGRGDRGRPQTGPSAFGGRIGVVAVALAVAVPALVPGLRAGWVGTDRSSVVGGAGGRSTVVVNPVVDLRRDLTLAEPVEVMRVRTTDPDPDYLRMVALDVFDGTSWRQSRLAAPVTQRVARGLPAPLGLDSSVPTTTVRTRVRVGGLDVPWLPLPYPATDVDVRGDWRYDRVTRVVFSTRATTPGLRYVAVSQKVLPSRAALDAAPAPADGASELQLPPDLPRVLPELAAELTAGSTTAYRRAVALQDWFRTQFAYDTTVAAGNGSDALLGFLQDRRGYCEQFAATMALMARALGIPARVAVGFTPGVRTADGTWSITTRDAHAWPELYFPGVGWTRFEPTPRGDGRASAPAYSLPSAADGAVGDAGGATRSTPLQPPRDADPRSGPAGHLRDEGRTPLDRAPGRRAGLPVLPVLGLVLLVALATPATVDRLARRRRWSRLRTAGDCARAGWDEVRGAAVDLGFGVSAADSPRAAARRLAAAAPLGPDDAAALARLAGAEELARYAPPPRPAPITSVDRGRARADAARVRAALARRVGWSRRWRARMFPPALLAEARTVAAGAVDAVVRRGRAGWPTRRGADARGRGT